jgi:hypothetical protein
VAAVCGQEVTTMAIDHTVTLRVPDHIYEEARQVAQATAQSIEQVLTRRLEDAYTTLSKLLPDEQAELAALHYLSNDTLRSITREQMPHSTQDRIQGLGDRNSRGIITTDEFEEYTTLVEQGERLMLRKAWAAGVLMERGFKITADDMAGRVE